MLINNRNHRYKQRCERRLKIRGILSQREDVLANCQTGHRNLSKDVSHTSSKIITEKFLACKTSLRVSETSCMTSDVPDKEYERLLYRSFLYLRS